MGKKNDDSVLNPFLIGFILIMYIIVGFLLFITGGFFSGYLGFFIITAYSFIFSIYSIIHNIHYKKLIV